MSSMGLDTESTTMCEDKAVSSSWMQAAKGGVRTWLQLLWQFTDCTVIHSSQVRATEHLAEDILDEFLIICTHLSCIGLWVPCLHSYLTVPMHSRQNVSFIDKQKPSERNYLPGIRCKPVALPRPELSLLTGSINPPVGLDLDLI